MNNEKVDSYNFKKYNTNNPIVRFLFKSFFDKIKSIIKKHNFKSTLEAGCGEGFAIRILNDILPDELVAFDINKDSLDYASKHCPKGEFLNLDICDLPFKDGSFDFTMCCEVLEHLKKPENALAELLRVTSGTLLLSVPNEPLFSMGSFCRGKYLLRLGRHPEHIQAWNKKSLRAFIEQKYSGNFEIYHSFPWLITVIEK